MWPSDEIISELSTNISRDFYMDVRNAFNTNLSRLKTIISDMALRRKYGIEAISAGSATEGTETSQSDTDFMLIVPDMKVIMAADDPHSTYDDISSSQQRQNDVETSFCLRCRDGIKQTKDDCVRALFCDHMNLYSATSKWSNPGYIRLAPIKFSNKLTKSFLKVENMLTETENGIFLSSDKYTQVNTHMTEKDRPSTFTDFYKHGPCVATTFQTIYGYRTERSGLELDIDMCMTIECDEWPVVAKEWITRERKHLWPPLHLIEKIAKLKCYAVPVGDVTSDTAHLDWRVSFLPAEREMVWNWNDIHIQCYSILKMLRQNCIEPVAPDTISSYHLKTIIFWLAENERITQWTHDNLLNCVRKCLTFLVSCIKQGHLPHYFYSTNNLFRSKFGNTSIQQKDAVIEVVDTMLDDISYIVENGLVETSVISEMWGCCSDSRELIDMCRNRPELSDMFDVNKRANGAIRFSSSVLLLCNYLAAIMPTLESLLGLQAGLDDLYGSSSDFDKCYIELIKNFIDIRLGLTSLVHSLHADTSIERDLFSVRAKLSIEDGQNFESLLTYSDNKIYWFDVGSTSKEVDLTSKQCQMLTSRLYMATYHLAMEDYVTCRDIVVKELTTYRVIVYTGRCSDNQGIITGIDAEDDMYAHTTFIPITDDPDEIINTAIDIIVSKRDAAFVPDPLRYECAMFENYGDGSFLIHPLIYAELLLFLSYFYENKMRSARNSLRKFEEVVLDLGYTPLRYQALNIVGYCFSLIGDFDKSLSCYVSSLLETNHRVNVRNAAGYLIGVLVIRAMSSKKEGDRGWVETIYSREKE